MHILILVHDLQLGGAERIALRLGSEWSGKGQQVTVFCGQAEGPLRSVIGEEVRLVAADPPIARGRFSRFRLASRAAKLVRHEKPHLIFLPGNYYFDAAAALKARLGSACPPIVGKISNALSRPEKGRAGQAAYTAWFSFKSRFVDHIVTMSLGLLAEARRVVPGASSKLSTVAQPVLDGSGTPPASRLKADGPRRLVAAGRLAPQKNFHLLLDAFDRVRRECEATLDIFGEGPLRPQLEERTRELGLTGSVRLRGYVPSLDEHLGDYDLFVLSSDFEGFPSVLVEAFAAGLPVVTTDCSPAVADLMDDDALGQVVPVRDPDALAGAIVGMLARQIERPERLTRRAREYDLATSARNYLMLFERIVEGERA